MLQQQELQGLPESFTTSACTDPVFALEFVAEALGTERTERMSVLRNFYRWMEAEGFGTVSAESIGDPDDPRYSSVIGWWLSEASGSRGVALSTAREVRRLLDYLCDRYKLPYDTARELRVLRGLQQGGTLVEFADGGANALLCRHGRSSIEAYLASRGESLKKAALINARCWLNRFFDWEQLPALLGVVPEEAKTSEPSTPEPTLSEESARAEGSQETADPAAEATAPEAEVPTPERGDETAEQPAAEPKSSDLPTQGEETLTAESQPEPPTPLPDPASPVEEPTPPESAAERGDSADQCTESTLPAVEAESAVEPNASQPEPAPPEVGAEPLAQSAQPLVGGEQAATAAEVPLAPPEKKAASRPRKRSEQKAPEIGSLRLSGSVAGLIETRLAPSCFYAEGKLQFGRGVPHDMQNLIRHSLSLIEFLLAESSMTIDEVLAITNRSAASAAELVNPAARGRASSMLKTQIEALRAANLGSVLEHFGHRKLFVDFEGEPLAESES